MSTDSKRWIRWWIVLGAILAAGWLVDRDLWVFLLIPVCTLPD